MARRRPLRFELLEDRVTPAYGLDPTFGAGGKAVVREVGGAQLTIGHEVVAQPDGKLVTLVEVGTGGDSLGLVRFNPDGTTDSTFGTGGLVRLAALGGHDPRLSASKLFALPDGDLMVGLPRTVVTGGSYVPGNPLVFSAYGDFSTVNGNQSYEGATPITIFDASSYLAPAPTDTQAYANQVVVTRLHADGSPDVAYGTAGVATIDFGTGDGYYSAGPTVGANGKVTAFADYYNDSTPDVVRVARLNADGTADATFDGDGQLALSVPSVTEPMSYGSRQLKELGVYAVAVGADGSVVLGGSSAWNAQNPFLPGGELQGAALVRLTPTGAFDPAFGTGGVTTIGTADFYHPMARSITNVSVLADGHVVGLLFNGYSLGMDVVRVTPTGSLDPTFGGGDGMSPLTGLNNPPRSTFAAAADGRVVVATDKYNYNWYHPDEPVKYGWDDITVYAFNPDGSTDLNFTRGAASITFPFDVVPGGADVPYGVSVLGDGRVVVVGRAQVVPTPDDAYKGYYGKETGRPALAVFADDGVPFLLPESDPPPDEPTGTDAPPPHPTAVQPVFVTTATETASPVAVLGGFICTIPVPVLPLSNESLPPAPDLPAVAAAKSAATTPVGVPENPFGDDAPFTVATGDIDGDGLADAVVAAAAGGGPRLLVFLGRDLAAGVTAPAVSFWGLPDSAFRGGVRVAVGDLDGDGKAEVVAAAGAGGGPRVTVWSGASVAAGSPAAVADFFAFEPGLRNGATVAVGDLDGDGTAELVFGAADGGAPRVRVFAAAPLLAAGPFADPADVPGADVADFYAGDPSLSTGVRVAVREADGVTALVTTTGPEDAPAVRVYPAAALAESPLDPSPLDATLAGPFVGV